MYLLQVLHWVVQQGNERKFMGEMNRLNINFRYITQQKTELSISFKYMCMLKYYVLLGIVMLMGQNVNCCWRRGNVTAKN